MYFHTVFCITKVNCNEERQKETVLAALVDTSSTPQNKPVLRLEPLIEEFESLDNTPTSYEHREVGTRRKNF